MAFNFWQTLSVTGPVFNFVIETFSPPTIAGMIRADEGKIGRAATYAAPVNVILTIEKVA